MMLLLGFFGVLFFVSIAAQDPCDTSHPLVPNVQSRMPSTKVEVLPNDNHLTERYYSAGETFDMVMSMEAGKSACGSYTQCWMNDDIPTVDEGEKDKRICCSSLFEPGNSCFETFTIKVTNCGDYRLYFLLGLGSRASGGRYCFDIQDRSNDPAPEFTPSNVRIVPTLIQIEQNNISHPILKFLCDFTENPGLFYTIFFHVNGKFISGHIKNVPSTTEAFLLESELPSDANTMGIIISCAVGAMTTSNGQVGNMMKSPDFFAGLKVENGKHVSLPRGGDHSIRVRPTVPIGCKSTLNEPDRSCEAFTYLIDGSESFSYLNCNVVNIANHHKCSEGMQGGTSAEFIVGEKWNVSYNFSISTFEDDKTSYSLPDKTYIFQLRVNHQNNHGFWNGRSESVTVSIYEPQDTAIWKGKVCSIVCDPHMRTFDSQLYELQKSGVYTAFQHSTLPIQVQVKSTNCGWPSAFCICGVAVIVGKSYHILDLCDQSKRVEYICGKHDELQVIPRDNDFEFRVPTGLKITVTRRFKKFWDIYIYPTVLEVNRTSGLCGSLDDNRCNDFTHKDENMTIDACTKLWWFHPNNFTDSFKLQKSEHIFQDDNEKFDKFVSELPDYPDNQLLCFCPYSDKVQPATTLGTNDNVQEAVCGFRQYVSCSKTTSSCQNRHFSLRRRRSTFDSQTINNDRMERSHALINKRSTMDETAARTFCEVHMLQNPLRTQCQEMNVDNSDTEIENCVLDLLATGDTDWASLASDRASQVCLTEVKKNATIQQTFPESASLVRNLTCPNNCTNNGICENGECSCSDGFAATDCSLDLAVSPDVDSLSLGPDPICDVRDDCSEVHVNGGDFPSNRTYTCRYSMFHVDNNGSKSFAGFAEVPGHQRNIYQVTCPLTYAERHEDVFVLEYELFLKMDNNSFSSGLSFVVLDSTCQGFIESSGKYLYFPESGYCFINRTCYEEGAEKSNDICQICVSSVNPYVWTTASDEDECSAVVVSDPRPTTSTDGHVPLIIALVVLTVICVAAIIVTIFTKFQRKTYILNSQTGSQHNLSRHPKSSQDMGVVTVGIVEMNRRRN